MSSQIEKSDSVLQFLAKASLLIYPLVAHIGILADRVLWTAGYLLIVVFINGLMLLSKHNALTLGFITFMSLLFYALVNFDIYAFVVYLPPVLIPAWLAFIFIGSLFSETALISKIAVRIEGEPLDQQHLRYTRRLTGLWGLVFVLMICEAIVLAIWAPYELWSWWVHVGNYFVIAILFLGEMMVRKRIIGRSVQPGRMLKAFIRPGWHR
jgi:uncharacterized membrane protein